MARAFVAVGANLEPQANILAALAELQARVGVEASSAFYRTPPLDRPEQPDFRNGVWRLPADLPPRELKALLREVEAGLGRVRSADRHAPRPIDLDLLLHGDLVADEPGLTLPDPDIRRRAFVAGPLLEVAPGVAMPDTGEPVAAFVPPGWREGFRLDEELTRAIRERLEP